MTDHRLDPPTTSVPPACTLPVAEQPLRLAEFDDLLRRDVRAIHRIDAGSVQLELAPGPEVAARVAELAARETACCSFFTFTLTVAEGLLVLGIRTPPSYADVLDSFSALAGTVGGPA